MHNVLRPLLQLVFVVFGGIAFAVVLTHIFELAASHLEPLLVRV